MVPRLPKNNGKGRSFKGAAQYYLHDKGADTSDRVEWTQTLNLAVDDPDQAWRIMAATAMDKERLKQQAGVKNTGRKSNLDVLHFSLSWHPEQKDGLTQEEMMRAARGALKAIGAQDHQVLIVAHNDEPQPHIHLIVNRVSTNDGLMLSDSYTKTKLSDWAEKYEVETGKVYCENRIINNQMRRNGEYVRHGDVSRHIYEMQRSAAANDNDRAQAVAEQQRRKDAALAKRGRNMAELQRRARDKLHEAHESRKAALARDLERRIETKRGEVREAYRPKWRELNQHQRAEQQTFEELEQSFFGRTSNMLKTVKLSRSDIGGDKSGVISRSFRILTNAGARREYFEKAQERARTSLQRDQALKVSEAAKTLRASQEAKFAQNRAVFERQRDELARQHEAKRIALQGSWKKRSAERKAAFAAVPAREPEKKTPAPTRAQKIQAALERSKAQRDFDAARLSKTPEQDNSREQSSGSTERQGSGDNGDTKSPRPRRRQRRPRSSRPAGRKGPDRGR